MTNEEAIKLLSYDNTAYGGLCTEEVRNVAIGALEKQIPKKNQHTKAMVMHQTERLYGMSGYVRTAVQNTKWTMMIMITALIADRR